MTEQIEAGEQPIGQMNTMSMSTGMTGNDVRETVPYAPTIEGRSHVPVAPQMSNGGCSCSGAGGISQNGAGVISYVYAIGRVEARFPNLAAEKEFAQATGRADTAGKTDQQAFHEVLSQRQNRYLVRQLCWVLTIQGLETYLLQPRDPSDIDMLIDAIRPAPTPERYRRGYRPARTHCTARNVQRTHGSYCRFRPDLLIRARHPHQGDSQAGKRRGKTIRPGSRRTIPPHYANDG